MAMYSILGSLNPEFFSMPFEDYGPFGPSVPTGGIIWPIFIIIIGSLLGISIAQLCNPKEKRFLSILFIGAFFTRIFIAVFLRLFSLSKGGDGFFIGDGFAYFMNGKYIFTKIWNLGFKIEDLGAFGLLSVSGTITNYDFWNAIIYSYTSVNAYNMLFVNCFFGAITSIVVFYIAKFVTKELNVARIAAILAAFWPSFVLWSTQNLKEAIVIFSICMIMLVFLHIRYNYKISYIIFGILPLYFIYELQKMLLLLFIIILPISVFFSSRFWRDNRKECIILLIIGTICLGKPIFNVIKGFAIGHGFAMLDPENVLSMLSSRREEAAYGNLPFLGTFDISTLPRAILYLPLGLAYTWFAPFPWQAGSLKQIMAIPETLLFYFLLPSTISGFRYIIKNRWRESSPIIIFIAGISVLLALAEGNVGTLFRHRAIIMYFILIFTSFGVIQRRKEKNNVQ